MNAADFEGGYRINRTTTELSGNKPHWYKPENDNTQRETYIFYDAFYGWWQIGYSLHDFEQTMLICMDDAIYPQDCTEWYDEYNQDLGKIISLNADECSSSDFLKVSDETGNTNAWEVIGITLAVIIILCCCLIIVYWYDKKNKGKAEIVSPTDLPSSGKGGITGGNVELQEEADNQPLAAGTTTGGMDMSPLNPNEGNDTINDDDIVNDEVDEPNNDVLDNNEQDGLMDKEENITAGNDDEDVIPADDADDADADDDESIDNE